MLLVVRWLRQTGVLRNSVSEPSDANGIAVFKDLRIDGATTKALYLWFNVQGTTLSWHRADLKTLPILLKTTVHKVEIASTAESSVVEGVALTTMTVRVTVICTHTCALAHTCSCVCTPQHMLTCQPGVLAGRKRCALEGQVGLCNAANGPWPASW